MPEALRICRPTLAWDGERLWERPRVGWDAKGRIQFIEESEEAAEEIGGFLMPGLINGHTHLEIGALQTAPRLGLTAWVQAMRATGQIGAAAAGRAVYAAIRAGTAAVVDVGNTGVAAGVAAAARLPGLYFRELLGLNRTELPEEFLGEHLTPHAPYSVHPELIGACVQRARERNHPWTIHFDEDPEEARFLLSGEGAWPVYLRALGRDLSSFPIPQCSPAAYLGRYDLRRALLVHASCSRGADLDQIAQSGAAVVLCPRSNLHITGILPDLPGLLDRKVPLLIGTDSLASTPNMDLLQEAATLHQQVPSLPLPRLMGMLTGEAASVLGWPLGRLAVGEAPGLLHVHMPEPSLEQLFDGTVWPRRWLACPELG